MIIEPPDYQSIMLPIMKYASDQKEHSLIETIDHISKVFDLNEDSKKELLPSGKQTIIANRVGWALTYLKKAGLLESTRRAYFRITKRGLDVVKEKPPKINVEYLERFPEFLEFRTIKKDEKKSGAQKTLLESLNPEELLEDADQKLKSELADDLLREVTKREPAFLEQIVVDLMVRMGYGGSRKRSGASNRADLR